jgi:hypothetical protein
MCIVVQPNTYIEWIFADGEWEDVRYAVENRYHIAAKTRTALIGFLEGEDMRNKVALGDRYRLGNGDRIVVVRHPLNSTVYRRWVPSAINFAETNPELEPVVIASYGEKAHIRERYAPRKAHPSRKVIEEHCIGFRITPTEIEPIKTPMCTLCNWLIGGAHPEKKCPTRNHPAIPRSWRGIRHIPEPKGVLQSDRTQVDEPSTVDEMARIMWIDHDGRYWVAKDKKSGKSGV